MGIFEFYMGGETLKILIIGDWTIDQNWICGVHRSSISSRIGQMHLRGLNEKDGATEALCGAGATASIMHRAKNSDAFLDISITGMGVWHEDDTDCLIDMIHSASERQLQPSGRHTKPSPQRDAEKEHIKLINIAEVLETNKEENGNNSEKTTRIIRIYKHTGSQVELLSRVDWESHLPEGGNYWISNEDEAKKVVKRIRDDSTPFDAVVIKCLNKKVVSPFLLEELANDDQIGKTPWYISTKEWNPDWLSKLKFINCRLFIIPHVAVETAKRKGETTKWINGKGFATQQALGKIKEFRNKFEKDIKPTVVVFPSGHRILAVGPGKMEKEDEAGSDYCDDLLIIQNERNTFFDSFPVETPFASILFGALITMDLVNSEIRKNTTDTLAKALEFTRKYIKSENCRITNPEDWDPKENEVKFDLSDDTKLQGKFDWRFNTTLTDAQKKWESATKGLGIIYRENYGHFLELFRAASEVDNYICLDLRKRNILQKLLIELKQFKIGRRDKSSSCMIFAPPGSGKTRLAKSLAIAEGYNFLEFNITQMYKREQLVDIFDRISTEQGKSPKNPLLVFIDEINGLINQDRVYSAFLSPLEDGIYVRAEKIFHIAPCFWLFAGTNAPESSSKSSRSLEEDEAQKWNDFKSRLTFPKIDLSEAESDTKRLETVYIGTTILVNTFPDVRWITKKVLLLFWFLGGIVDLRMRQLVQFIRSFNDIQWGKVTSTNIPTERLEMQDIKWKIKDSPSLLDSANKYIIDEKDKGEGEGKWDELQCGSKNNNVLDCWKSISEGELIRIKW
ncbi:MAG: AAA family ATPase [Desulfobacterales bacterium]